MLVPTQRALVLYRVPAEEVQGAAGDLAVFREAGLLEALVQPPVTDAEALITLVVIARLKPLNAMHVGNWVTFLVTAQLRTADPSTRPEKPAINVVKLVISRATVPKRQRMVI